MAATVDGDERVMAAAQKIVKSLGTSKNVTEDMILILSSFDNRLSTITDLLSTGPGRGKGKAASGIEEEFEAAEQIVLRWDSNSETTPKRNSLPWEDSPNEAAEYLSAVDEILRLTEDLTLSADGEIMDRADNVLQVAMSRLEDEFRHILIRNTVPLDAGQLHGSIRRGVSFASNVGEIEDFESVIDDDRVSFYGDERRVSLGEDLCVELIHSDAVGDLKEIAERMIRSGYEKECCQVYSSVRRDVLDECLSVLGIEKLSIEEVQKIEWKHLDDKMKKWSHNVKVVVRGLLSGEKHLCDQIFQESELIKEVCFTETAKGCVMQLLTFGEAISIARRSPEKLFNILDMYEALARVMPDLQELFSYDSNEFVYSEARGILKDLGEAAKGTFIEFEKAVQNETSKKPTLGGEIHPLTRYVMNYVKLLVDYSNTLDFLLESNIDSGEGSKDDDEKSQLENVSPLCSRLQALISSLESNLEEKSKLYEDGGMQYVFLMNNILYIVQKVKDSDLGNLLGDHWVRKRRGQVRQYATGYLRASWSKVLSCLKDEGIGGGGRSSSNASKVVLKERFKSFNLGFEEIYRTQTAWKVTDPQLREELRISISEKVLPAYRSFMGMSHLLCWHLQKQREEWGIDPTKVTTPNSATIRYTEFLLATASGKVEGEKGLGKIATPFEKTKIAAYTLGAMTPCMRLYAFLGKEIKALMDPSESSHPYKKWIENYSSETFEASALQTEELLDTLSVSLTGEELEVIKNLYHQAMKLEIDFFSAQPIVQQTIIPLSGVLGSLGQRLILFSDFDLTCTVVDSSAILAEIAIITAPKLDQGGQEVVLSRKASVDLRNNWNFLSKQYTEEYEQCIERILPSAKAEKFNYGGLCKAIEQLSDFEKRANLRVIDSEVLKGINMEDIKRAGERIILQDGCIGFFQNIVKNEEVTAGVHVLSYCWCGDLIRSAFSSGGLNAVNIHSNEFAYEESISTGEILRKVESPMDKLQAFKDIQKNQNDAHKHLSVYIGDSVGDLLCLLEADVGIVIGSSASLRKVGSQFGISFVPLFSGLVKKQKEFSEGEEASCWKGLSGILYTVSSWAEIHAFILGR